MKEKILFNKGSTTVQGDKRLPDFIIVGAMKSGTTSLHYMLDQHKDIFIPNREIMFFDIDDIEQNFDFFVQTSNKWLFFDYKKNFDEYLVWYKSFFKEAKNGQVIGEDSTTYMASQKAPSRIADLLPEVKLIFMLRDSVLRTYSNYWHLVRTGHAIYNFEKTMQYMPGTLIQRSLYKKHIQRYKKYFPDKNMKFIIFKDFIKNNQRNIDDICKFIGLETSVDVRKINTHKNPTKVPINIRLQIVYNHLLRTQRLVTQEFGSHLPNLPQNEPKRFWRKMDKLVYKLNFTDKKSYPPMNYKTRKFLEKLFAKENRGLSKLIGKNLKKYWTYMEDLI